MSKTQYSPTEVAFIIGYADYCIHHGLDYSATIESEFIKISLRRASWANVQNKLGRLLKEYGVSNPSVSAFRTKGSRYVGIANIPLKVHEELNRLRSSWGLTPLNAKPTNAQALTATVTTDQEASSSDKTESFSARNQIAMDPGTDCDTATRHVENTPETKCSNYPVCETQSTFTLPESDDVQTLGGHDGASDRLSIPINSPTPSLITPLKQIAVRKAPDTPIDPNDSEYAPSPKRNKVSRSASGRVPAARRGVAVIKLKGKTRSYHAADSGRQVVDKADAAVSFESRSSSSTPIKARDVPVIVIEESSEETETVTRASQVAGPYEDNVILENQHDKEPCNQATSKRKAAAESEARIVCADHLPKRQKIGEATLESLVERLDSQSLKFNALLEIFSSTISHQHSPSEEFFEHIQQVVRTLKDPKDSIIENLIKDLNSQRALKAKHRDLVQNLVEFANVADGNVFPKTPSQKDVDQTWTRFYDHIVSTVGANNTEPRSTAEGAGYLTCAVESIANGRIADSELEACLNTLSRYLTSPHAQQTLFSALFCRWVFAFPEQMLDTMHSDGMMHLYEGILDAAETKADGLERVRQYDKVAMKLLLENPDSKTVLVVRRTSEFEVRFETAKHNLCKPSKIPSSLSPSSFAKEVMDFKQKLLLSPKEYRIYYVRPGYEFNAKWMQAYDNTNEPVPDSKAEGKNIDLCVFPALACLKDEAIKEDGKIEDVLCKNKQFFPTLDDLMLGFSPVAKWSKAMVLVS